MTVDPPEPPDELEEVRRDGGHPNPAELRIRLVRVEAKQDAQIEKLDYITEQLDGRLSTVNEKVDTMMPRHRRMWLIYKGSKWILGVAIAGGATIKITGLL